MATTFTFQDGTTVTGGSAFVPPAETGDYLADTLNTLRAQRLYVLQNGPKPRYSLHGHSVDWTAYLAQLDKSILAVRVERAQEEPFEEIGVGF